MCDSAGNLQFYSNGLRIANHLDQTMQFGDSLGYGNGNAWNYWKRNYPGSPFYQAGFALPLPGATDSIYYMFHEGTETDPTLLSVYSTPLYVSVIDMTKNNGSGRVVEKNIALINADTFFHSSACKHANGRDWWILIPEAHYHKAMIFLLTPNGITEQRELSIGAKHPNPRGIFQAIFSPDGSKYALHTNIGVIRLFDFDRCTGSLTFERDIPTDTLFCLVLK